MKNIIENDIRRMDLNLLLVFHVLLEEGSVTRTAERLFLGQPAISGALARLRTAFSDPLFVRTPRGMQPTARALELGQSIRPFIMRLHEQLQGAQPFDPATSRRTFHIGMSDAIEVALMPELLRYLTASAPGVRVISQQTDSHRIGAMLDDGAIELAVGVIDQPCPWHKRAALFDWHFVCLYNPALIELPDRRMTLETYLAYPHLLTSFSAGLSGFVDESLAAIGRERTVLFSSPNFFSSAFIVRESAAFTTMPNYIAEIWRDSLGLAISEVPLTLPGFAMSLIWAEVNDLDPGLSWLRAAALALWGGRK